jgi:hypothetical protein
LVPLVTVPVMVAAEAAAARTKNAQSALTIDFILIFQSAENSHWYPSPSGPD